MGTPDFAAESLKALVEAGHNIVGVVTNPDKPKGRGMNIVSSPVKEYAMSQNLKVYQPIKVRNNVEFLEEIKCLNLDLICVVAYGKILPKEFLDIPKFGCVNVHGSLLPKYRGAAPIQWAVLNGDSKTGITTMFMDEGMDTGDMILKEEVEIGENETTGELWGRLSKVGASLLVETLAKIEEALDSKVLQDAQTVKLAAKPNTNYQEIRKEYVKNTLKKLIGATKQGDNFTLAPMLNKEMAKIDWENKSAEEIKNLIRGLNPIMGAYTYINEKKIKFWKAEKLTLEELIKKNEELAEYRDNVEKVASGAVLFSNPKQGLYIKANDGIISVLEIQGENSKKMGISEFLRGNAIDAGSLFE